MKTWKEAHDTWKFPKIPHHREYRMYHPDTGIHPARTRTYIVNRIIRTYSRLDSWVLDPMCGVGTTLIEAMLAGRNAIGIESEKKYADVASLNVMRISSQGRLGAPIHIDGRVYQGYAEELTINLIEDGEWCELITFSPPYEGISHTYRSASGRYKHEPDECRGFDTSVIDAKDRQVKRFYSDDPRNIANMKGESYWLMMELIYDTLYDVGDRMVLIVKNQIKDHKERDFAQETIRQISLNTRWKFRRAHLAMLPGTTHWENVRRKKYPHADKVDWEHVLVFGHGGL